MIEAFWRVLKHQWLFLNHLRALATPRRLVEFYVNQPNSVLPHSAFQGRTPDEMVFGTGEEIPSQLAAAREKARQARPRKEPTIELRLLSSRDVEGGQRVNCPTSGLATVPISPHDSRIVGSVVSRIRFSKNSAKALSTSRRGRRQEIGSALAPVVGCWCKKVLNVLVNGDAAFESRPVKK
jgi:hypothetical protein